MDDSKQEISAEKNEGMENGNKDHETTNSRSVASPETKELKMETQDVDMQDAAAETNEEISNNDKSQESDAVIDSAQTDSKTSLFQYNYRQSEDIL